MTDGSTTLKGAIIRVACQAAARWYSWIRPPRRSRRWIVPTCDSFLWLVRVGRTKFKGTMRPLAVVMVDLDAEHAFEVASVEDQQPVEALRTDCSDEALRDCVRLRRSDGRLHDPDAFAAENVVEGDAVLAVAVADEEADSLFGEVETEVARLLG